MERRARLEHLVGGLEPVGEGLDVREVAVAGRVHVSEVEHGAHPAEPARDLEHVVERSRNRGPGPSPRSPNGTARTFGLEPLAQIPELFGDGVDRDLARAAEQEAGVEDDELGARGHRDPGGVVEHPDRHVELLAAVERGP